jgi:hypothetical protein
MKKMLMLSSICAALLFVYSCGNTEAVEKNHTHEDGSTHADHDTTKPVQQEFIVGDSTHKDSATKEHTHKDGEKHAH